jgi:hypothetical protein
MSYVVVEDVAASWEHYRRFEEALAGPIPAGLIVHAAGPTEEGFRIVGVWESEEAWRSFLANRLAGGAGADGAVPPVSRPLRPAHVVIGDRLRRPAPRLPTTPMR